MLELFSGTGSFGKVFSDMGWEVVSVDLYEGNPTHRMNVLDIPLDMWPEGHFSHIHSSPPCTLFSRCRSTAKEEGDKQLSLRMVLHSLVLIRALQPLSWTIENPATGTLKNESFMRSLKFADC